MEQPVEVFLILKFFFHLCFLFTSLLDPRHIAINELMNVNELK